MLSRPVMLCAHARPIGPLPCYEISILGFMLLRTVGCAALSVTDGTAVTINNPHYQHSGTRQPKLEGMVKLHAVH